MINQGKVTKAILHRSAASLMVSLTTFLLMAGAAVYYGNLSQEHQDLTKKLASLNSLAVRSQEALAFVQAHREEFMHFEATRFEEALTPEMIQETIGHKVDFGAFSLLGAPGETLGYGTQEAAFSIACMNDREAYALMDRLIGKGPGIFQIHEITLTRIADLNEGLLEKIAAGKPQPFIEGQVLATWIHR